MQKSKKTTGREVASMQNSVELLLVEYGKASLAPGGRDSPPRHSARQISNSCIDLLQNRAMQ
jgi:hypothetical protein